MKIFKILLLSMFLFITGSISVNADTATGSVTVNVLLSCTPPLTQTVTVPCDERAGFTVTGSVIRTQTKDTESCLFGTPITNENSTYVDDSCVYTPSLCPAPLTREAVFDCDPMVGFTVTGSITRTQTKDPTTCLFSDPITGSNSSIKNNACVYTAIDGGGDVDINGNCINGATNPPLCNIFIPNTDGYYTSWIGNITTCPQTITQTRDYVKATGTGEDLPVTTDTTRSISISSSECLDLSRIDVTQIQKVNSVLKDVKINIKDEKITDFKILYNSFVKIWWNAKNTVEPCKCDYMDSLTSGACKNNDSPLLSSPLKRDTTYTISCVGKYGLTESSSVKVLVDKINPDYLEN